MRRSKVLEKLRSGKVAYCTQVGSAFAPFAGIAALTGFDCIWLDHEHKNVDYQQLNECVMAASIFDCDTVFRILKRSYADYFRPLEDGATGVMIPHVMSVKDAEFAVYNTKFYPVGARGMDTSCLGCDYSMTDTDTIINHTLNETFTMLQIEDIEALESVEEIAKVDGVDILFVGPADLTQSAKRHGIWYENFLIDAFERVGKACACAKDIWWGTSIGTIEMAKSVYDRGGRFISMRGDYSAVKAGFRKTYEELKNTFGD